MKPLSIKQLLAISTLAIVLPFSALSHAGSAKDCGRHNYKHGHTSNHGGNFGESGAVRHLKTLNLTQDQQDKIFVIVHEQAPAKYTHRKQQRETMEALRTLAQADKLDEAKAQQLTDQLGKIEKEKALSRFKTEAKINALLTPEQREKALKFRASGNRWQTKGEPARYKQKTAPAAKPLNS